MSGADQEACRASLLAGVPHVPHVPHVPYVPGRNTWACGWWWGGSHHVLPPCHSRLVGALLPVLLGAGCGGGASRLPSRDLGGVLGEVCTREPPARQGLVRQQQQQVVCWGIPTAQWDAKKGRVQSARRPVKTLIHSLVQQLVNLAVLCM